MALQFPPRLILVMFIISDHQRSSTIFSLHRLTASYASWMAFAVGTARRSALIVSTLSRLRPCAFLNPAFPHA
jgi:hypothetical protein